MQTYDFTNEEGGLDNYIQNKSVSYIGLKKDGTQNPETMAGLSILPTLKICSFQNGKHKERPYIATIGNIPVSIKERIINEAKPYKDTLKLEITNDNFKNFESIDKLNDYVKDPKYGQDGYPLICFGMRLEKNGDKYDYSLHYFDSIFAQGVQDIPSLRDGIFDQFTNGPDLSSFKLYQTSGYLYIMKLINEYILQQKKENSKIDFGMVALPYTNYRVDSFSGVLGYMLPLFIVVAYMCPLCLYVYRMVGEKESKSKEGMKIMGLGEGIYFLSYFIQFVIISLVNSVINALILNLIFTKIPYFILFVVLFLWTLDVFALIFFFQSIIDKTRVALILSLLIYFVMFFLSMACMDESAALALKIVLSIFPPVDIMIGTILFGKFQSNFRTFHGYDYIKIYTNYSIFIMNLMQFIDFLLYLFLGYYLQNVLPHEFGIKKPWYFLFTSDYWCENKNKKDKYKHDKIIENFNINGVEVVQINKNKNIEKENDGKDSQIRKLNSYENDKSSLKHKRDNNKDSKNFESEDLYQDRTKPDDALRIRGIVKVFGDGKKAVNNVNLNFYKDEIFALLGHNGAGKTTLISMLTGLYEATEGQAFYDGYDILDSNNMDRFRNVLGICPQHDVLFEDLTIREHLEMFCIFKGFETGNLENEINKTIHDFELDDIQNITAKNLSAGQRRKLSIAISLIGGSKVIFLDEPSSGMDITSRRNLWDILKRQSEQKIIILTTHYMEEASVLGQRIGIINAGKMKCIGTPLFLIERFGKFMSLNVTKEEDANSMEIVEFIEQRAKNVEYEILSEEIMFRIPKSNYSQETQNNNILNSSEINQKTTGITQFFEDLDNNLKNLKIKSYSASMPTLEDVFLNVAAEDTKLENQKGSIQHRRFSLTNANNDRILFETNFMENYQNSGKSKFCNDFIACFHRRFLLTIRDIKGFLMEILCPILLVLIGMIVCQVQIFSSSKPTTLDLGATGNQQILFGGVKDVNDLDKYYFKDMENITNKEIDMSSFDLTIQDNDKKAIKHFVEKVFEKAKEKEDDVDHEVDMMHKDYFGYYGAILFLKNKDCKYEFVEIINTRVRHGALLYSYFFLKKIIEKEYPEAEINFIHYPLPLTAELEEQSGQTNNNLVIFFVAIAFSLIPANFITIIVKERINNSKHLMRVSGISIVAYWIVNYIFEIVKYYFTCGICLLLLFAFSFYRKYLEILYVCYGPSMISVTYILSFLFDSESNAQNSTILLNFLLGALGGVVIFMLRSMEDIKEAAKILQYIIGLLPSFCFNFGYSILLNKIMIYMTDYPNEWFFFKDDVLVKKFNLLLSLIIYLCVEFCIYTIILIIIEFFSYTSRKVGDERMNTQINDSLVLKENDKANDPSIRINDENGKSNKIEYAIRVKNLRKEYSTGFCSKPTIAIRNMSFCVEPGECFGLLGLNGAGKTTTFKCITQELSPTHGKIYINGRDMRNNFDELSSIFGYCPQFDAIFEYMTVYENLEFYGKIKGIKKEYLKEVINAMIEEMSLSEFTNKIAGRLSGGNKRKLSVAISFLCSPPIVLLDEPSTGMDPEARRFMWSVIHKISTKGKKASVIMTTHSMDEAETLCKRMAIMVNGEFVCLGKSIQIKEKYGYGYEIDVRIKPLSEDKFESLLSNKFDRNLKINMDNINQILTELNEKNYIDELKQGRFGSKLIRDIKMNNGIPIRTLISWIFFVKNALKFIQKAKQYFEEIILTEHIDNNFLFKMKKNNETKSIGFFFGLFENNKDECFVTEYSIQQTSLEQIFNMFENEHKKLKDNGERDNKLEEEKKQEIIINDDVYNALLK